MIYFHRTSVSGAREIKSRGFEDDTWSFGLVDVTTGESIKQTGVWLTDRPLSLEEGPPGDAVLEVTMEFSEETLSAFELEGVFRDARLWVVPAEIVNPHSEVRILAVDPGISGQFEIVDDDQI